jgi:hypothetical protein
MIRPIEAIEGRKEILFSFSAASGSGQAQCAAPFNQGRLAPIRAINRPSAFREGAVGIEVYQGSCVKGGGSRIASRRTTSFCTNGCFCGHHMWVDKT